MKSNRFYKNNDTDAVWWVDSDSVGEFLFSFDKRKVFNLFADYPHNLTDNQIKVFDRENPLWAEYFKDRKREK